MARPATTPAQRIANVRTAYSSLATLIDRAVSASTNLSDDDVCECAACKSDGAGITERECGGHARAAWAAVEVHGAAIHRQSRLLAGKSKGG